MKELLLSEIYERLLTIEVRLKYFVNEKWSNQLIIRNHNLRKIIKRNLEFSPSEMNKIITLKELI